MNSLLVCVISGVVGVYGLRAITNGEIRIKGRRRKGMVVEGTLARVLGFLFVLQSIAMLWIFFSRTN